MPFHELAAILMFCGFYIKSIKRLPNGYCGDSDTSNCEICKKSPWWEVKTHQFTFTIGWRKRVINIDWSAVTDVEVTGYEITDDEVTRGMNYIHAWGEGKAIQYLKVLECTLANKRIVKQINRTAD